MATKKKKTHSTQYEKYEKRYKRSGATKDQLRQLVGLGILTEDEFVEITGEPYAE